MRLEIKTYIMQEDKLLTEIYALLAQGGGDSIHKLIEQKKKEYDITSDRQLAAILGINKDTLSRILNGDSQKVDILSLIKISNFLGLRIEDMVQIYVSSLKADSISEIEKSRKINFILRNFDLNGLKRIGFIKNTNDFESIEKRINTFFGLNDIFGYADLVAVPMLNNKSKLTYSEKMKFFWIKSAYIQFEKINNPNEFDTDSFRKILPKIRAYSRMEENGLLTVIRALYQVGITVIVQEYLTKTAIHGASFVVKGKPCIVLTNHFKQYDIIWFTLMHELCHILYDYDDLKTKKFHLSGEPDLFLLNEERANHFAREMLFSDEKLNFIEPHIKNHLYVEKYAKDNNVHSSIIYGFYLHDKKVQGKDYYKFYSKFRPSSENAIKMVKLWPYDEERLIDQVESIVEIINSNE